MAVPDFQSLMLPLLRIAADGKEHTLAETRPLLAAEFNLSAADQDELLPSGRQSRFVNRTSWAKIYLERAGLLLSPRRGRFQVTDRGLELLKEPPARIDIELLKQYPGFSEFRKTKDDGGQEPGLTHTDAETETPEEGS